MCELVNIIQFAYLYMYILNQILKDRYRLDINKKAYLISHLSNEVLAQFTFCMYLFRLYFM